MYPNLNIWLALLLIACLRTPVNAQTASPASGSAITFHDVARSESATQSPAALQQLTVELVGTLVGHSPNPSIRFALSLQNVGPGDVEIQDPLHIFSLQFTTADNKLIPLPNRVPSFLPKVGVPRNGSRGMKYDGPYPAPVQFRQIVTAAGASSQKEEVVVIPSGGKVQILFDSEPVVMQKVMEALRTETGEAATSFRAKAFMSLVTAPPQASGRSMYSDPISFKIPKP